MSNRRAVSLLCLGAVFSISVATAAVASPAGEGAATAGVSGMMAPVPGTITYQGQLTDPAGNLLTGAYDLAFQVWDDAAAGSQLGPDVLWTDVAVTKGLFAVDLDVADDAFNGQALWLRIAVDGQWLSPRQPLSPAPYALTLRPGAVIAGHSAEPVRTLSVVNLGVAPALRAEGVMVGLHALGLTAIKAEGPLGVFGSGLGPGGTGVRGITSDGTGVEGVAETGGTGVVGSAAGDAAKGVVGMVTGYTSIGVTGVSEFGVGVSATGETGVKAKGTVNFAVQAEGPMGIEAKGTLADGISAETAGDEPAAAVRGSAGTDAFGGHFTSEKGIGVWAIGVEGVHGQSTSEESNGVHGIGPGTGVRGESVDGVGVRGESTTGIGVVGHAESGVGVSAIGGDPGWVIFDGDYGVMATGDDYGISASGGRFGGAFGGPIGVQAGSSAEDGRGVDAHASGESGEAVRGTSELGVGIRGVASSTGAGAVGVWGETAGTYGLYTPQKIFTGGGCVGCTAVLLAQNGGTAALQAGDVVVVVGIVPPLPGQQTPRLSVRRAAAGDSGVLGVVQGRAVVETTPAALGDGPDQTVEVAVPVSGTGPAGRGDDLFVVLEGLARVRVDATFAPIEVGDAVSVAGRAGTVQAAAANAPDIATLGYALEPVDAGTGLVWVLLGGR